MRISSLMNVLLPALLALSFASPVHADDEAAAKHAAPAASAAAPAPAKEEHAEKTEHKAGSEKGEDGDPNDHTPVKYHVGVNVQKISKFELGPGTFEADFFVSYHCDKAPCAPKLSLENGEIKGKPEVIIDEPLHKKYRVKAELTTEIDVSEFPFDAHQLDIVVGDRDSTDVTFEKSTAEGDAPEPTDVKVAGWTTTDGDGAIVTEDMGDGQKASYYTYSVSLKRPGVAAFAKNFLPAFVMVLVLLISLFMKPKMAAARLAAGTGSFVAVIMFHNTATNALPPLGFLTRLDKFMFTLYLLWLVHITFSILILRSDEKKNEAQGEQLYKLAWIVLPVLALVEWGLVFAKIV